MVNLTKFTRRIKRLFTKDKPQQIIFFITNRCNSRCKHCFNWKVLNAEMNELSLEEIEKISKNLGEFPDLLLSGGEPFLRRDLADLCYIFYSNNKIVNLAIPTNSLLPETIRDKTIEILEKCKGINLTLNLSLDGLKETHENIRGVKGNFEKVFENIKGLTKIREKYPNLKINVSTVVFNENIKEIPELVEYVKKNTTVDFHGFEVIRGDPKIAKTGLTDAEFEKYKDIVLTTEEYYMSKKFNPLIKWYLLAKKKYFLNLQKDAMKTNKMDVQCLAGQSIFVLEHNGIVKGCELLEPLGNVRDGGYNPNKILKSKNGQIFVNRIKKTKCACTHCVFLYHSIDHDPITALIKIPLYGLLHKR